MNHNRHLDIEKLFFITRNKNSLDLEDYATLARINANIKIFFSFT